MPDAAFSVRVWGARGSIPAPAKGNIDYGTDTCCVEMRCGGRTLVFDAGTGATMLSRNLYQRRVTRFDLFFTHCHLDHIIGLPFMKQLYDPTTVARIFAGHFSDGTTCEDMVKGFMRPPYFPVTPRQFQGDISFHDFQPPDALAPADGIRVLTHRLNHPNGAVGYRVEFDGRSVCYITDNEHDPDRFDDALAAFVAGADIMIYDSAYTDAEFAARRGFGHSTWEEGVRVAEAAGVPTLVIFHHDVMRDDAALDAIGEAARARFPGAVMGRSGLVLDPARAT